MTTSDYTSEIPYGYCQCGCGQKTSLSSNTNKNRGIVRGKPLNFLRGHASKLRPISNPLNNPDIRFWPNVNKDGSIPAHMPHLGKCWEWIGSISVWGYGQFATKRLKAHRVSWQLTYGEIPNKLHVLHKCDNPLCVNPDHLFLGTQTDNMNDKVAKDRQLKGEESNLHKLTSQQVNEIRQRYLSGGISQSQLAREYGMTQQGISKIITRITWKS